MSVIEVLAYPNSLATATVADCNSLKSSESSDSVNHNHNHKDPRRHSLKFDNNSEAKLVTAGNVTMKAVTSNNNSLFNCHPKQVNHISSHISSHMRSQHSQSSACSQPSFPLCSLVSIDHHFSRHGNKTQLNPLLTPDQGRGRDELSDCASLIELGWHRSSSSPPSVKSPPAQEEWVQCSGHSGGFLPSKEGTIWKKVSSSKDDLEVYSYRQLMKEERMRAFVPTFFSCSQMKGEEYIEIEDLLHLFRQQSSPHSQRARSHPSSPTRHPANPCKLPHNPQSEKPTAAPHLYVMDIKMGTRTFLEKEAASPTERNDLFNKMVKIDPDEPTEEEKAKKSVTKLRYMTFRESLSSSSNLGFRIEGVQPPSSVRDENSIEPLEYQKIKGVEEVRDILRRFLKGNPSLQRQLLQRLRHFREEFSKCKFFQAHEVIGSSLLLIHDANQRLGVWMIDFAKTVPLPPHVSIDHRSPWKLGNHEDGFLFGLDNLIEITSTL